MDVAARPVPHHAVDARLYAAAKVKAAADGVSLSQVAADGLAAYVARSGSAAAPAPTGALDLEPLVAPLPGEVAAQLAGMRARRDPGLGLLVRALSDAGWTLQAVADGMGVSRQAVHQRLNRTEVGSAAHVRVPAPPFFRHSRPDRRGAAVDWAVWVPREAYVAAARQARARRMPMRDVMEGILREYVGECGAGGLSPSGRE